jgi:hypothetical protein
MEKTGRLYTLFLCLILGMGLCSCDGREIPADSEPQQRESMAKVDISNVSAVNKAQKDSIINNLEKKVETVDSLRSVLQDEVESYQKKSGEEIEDLQSLRNYALIGGILGLLSFIVAVVCLVKIEKYKEQTAGFRSKLNQLSAELKKTEKSMTPTPTASNNAGKDRLEHLEERVRKLEVNQTTKHSDTANKRSVGDVNAARQATITNGYFGTVIGNGYFKKLLTTKDSDARFKASVEGNHAKFEPISFRTAMSSDSMYNAIKFDGVPRDTAKDMKILSPGEALLEGERWVIRKKTEVQLIS